MILDCILDFSLPSLKLYSLMNHNGASIYLPINCSMKCVNENSVFVMLIFSFCHLLENETWFNVEIQWCICLHANQPFDEMPNSNFIKLYLVVINHKTYNLYRNSPLMNKLIQNNTLPFIPYKLLNVLSQVTKLGLMHSDSMEVSSH